MLQAFENSGIRMTIRRKFAGHWIEHAIWVQGDRRRMEFRNHLGGRKLVSGPRIAGITRCDLGQAFELNLDAAEYVSAPYPPQPLGQSELEARGWHRGISSAKEPTLRIETTTVDTGERKEYFGHLARHVIITRKQIPLGFSHSELQETITDGWYIDLDLNPPVSCDPKMNWGERAHVYIANANLPPEKLEFFDVGEQETGSPVKQVIVSKNVALLPDGTNKQTNSKSEMVVTQLELGPLDPALFEIPPGFKHVQQIERSPKSSASSGFWRRFKSNFASHFKIHSGES
jgi:hypothetical protein